jgi:hypothetical protein
MKYMYIVVLSLLLCTAAGFGQIAQGPASGSVASGVIQNTDNFESLDGPGINEPLHVHRHPPFNEAPMPPNMPAPTAPEGSNVFHDPSVNPHAPDSPPPITLASFQGNNQTSGFPPDPIIAVGPNHIMHLVNSSFRISTKSGTTLKTISANAWFQSTLPNSGPFDPKVFFDFHANRWVMVWDNQNDATQTAYFLVSVSDDDNPLGVWFNWALPSNVYGSTPSGTWQDYQGAGYDRDAYYITGRHFGFVSGYFGNAVRIMPKAQFLGGTPGAITWWDFWALRDANGVDVDGIRPAIVLSAPNEYYLAGPPSLSGGSYFALFRITNPLGTPAISCVTVPATAWSNAPAAGQPNGVQPFESGGSRVRHEPIYRDSSLWMAHSVGDAGFSNVRYVRINVPTNTTIEDVSFGAPGYYHFYPALAVDKDNNLGITFTRSSFSEFAGAYYTWRFASDPLGTLRPTELMRAGASTYVVTGGDGRNRWGDYMGAALDPADRNALWFLTEYVAATNTFGVWVHGIRLAPYTGARVASTVATRDFGRVEVGLSSDSMEIKINNIGSSTLTISSITKSNAAMNLFSLPSFPVNLATFDSLKFRVFFRPSAHGVVTDTIRIASNDAGTPTFRIPIQGKGVVIGRAAVGTLYGASGAPDTSRLYRINVNTGAATRIGETGVTEIQSLSIHPTTQELYGIVTTSTSSQLYRVSAAGGDALPARSIPLGNIRAIAFASDGTLWGGNNSGRLYRINITTGDTTFIGAHASTLVYASFSVNPITGKLWASVRPPIVNRDQIYTVNTTSGAATLVGVTGGNNITPAIAFDGRGRLYGLKGTATQIDTLIVIDTTTAFGTRIGPMGFAGIQAMAMRSDSVTSVREVAAEVPATFSLEQNYPNPFNPETKIRFTIPSRAEGYVSLRIYDMLGREVATLVDEQLKAGTFEAAFDATHLATGTYLYRLRAGAFTETKKMILLR